MRKRQRFLLAADTRTKISAVHGQLTHHQLPLSSTSNVHCIVTSRRRISRAHRRNRSTTAAAAIAPPPPHSIRCVGRGRWASGRRQRMRFRLRMVWSRCPLRLISQQSYNRNPVTFYNISSINFQPALHSFNFIFDTFGAF